MKFYQIQLDWINWIEFLWYTFIWCGRVHCFHSPYVLLMKWWISTILISLWCSQSSVDLKPLSVLLIILQVGNSIINAIDRTCSVIVNIIKYSYCTIIFSSIINVLTVLLFYSIVKLPLTCGVEPVMVSVYSS